MEASLLYQGSIRNLFTGPTTYQCHRGCRLPSCSWRNTSPDSDLGFLASWRAQVPDADPIYAAECRDAARLHPELHRCIAGPGCEVPKTRQRSSTLRGRRGSRRGAGTGNFSIHWHPVVSSSAGTVRRTRRFPLTPRSCPFCNAGLGAPAFLRLCWKSPLGCVATPST